jgi:hypothetical protein
MQESVSRRQFVRLGASSVFLLQAALSPWKLWGMMQGEERNWSVLRTKDIEVLRKIIPEVVGWGDLKADDAELYLHMTLRRLDQLLGDLADASRGDLILLLDLLQFPVSRMFLGLWSSWDKARGEDVRAFLESWEQSWLTLKRFGYQSLVQLIHFAWYGTEAGQKRSGYPGPSATIRAFLSRSEGESHGVN